MSGPGAHRGVVNWVSFAPRETLGEAGKPVLLLASASEVRRSMGGGGLRP